MAESLLVIGMCLVSLLSGLLLAAICVLIEDRKARLKTGEEIVKVKAEFSDMLVKACEANNSHAAELMRVKDQLQAHELRFGVVQGSKR